MHILVSSQRVVVFVLSKDIVNVILFILGVLAADNVPEVERVFPEDEHHDHFEDQVDVGDEADEATQHVLVAAILLIFFTCAHIEEEEPEKVVDPGDGQE